MSLPTAVATLGRAPRAGLAFAKNVSTWRMFHDLLTQPNENTQLLENSSNSLIVNQSKDKPSKGFDAAYFEPCSEVEAKAAGVVLAPAWRPAVAEHGRFGPKLSRTWMTCRSQTPTTLE